MSKDHQAADAGAAINTPPSNDPQNIGLGEFLASRNKVAGESAPEPEQETEVETQEEVEDQPEAELETTESEGIVEDGEAEFDPDSVLSQLENLSSEERKKLQDRSVARFGEMTARIKQLESKLDEVSSKKKEEENPFEETRVENNPYGELNSFEELSQKAEALNQIDEWADKLLWKHRNADPDDVIVTEDGQDYTAEQVRELQLNARKGIKKFLPARWKEIQQSTVAKQQEEAINKQVKAQLAWMKDEESDNYKAYQNTINNPVMNEIREKVPSVAPQLNAIIAHAINSMSGATAKATMSSPKQDKKPAASSKPPSNPPSGFSQSPMGGDDKISKQLKELESRFHETGSLDDFKALRAIKHAKR